MRLDPETRAREGQETELWADLRGMHVFNPATGANISLDDGSDSLVVGGSTAGTTTAGTTQEVPAADPPSAPAPTADDTSADSPAGPVTPGAGPA